jgi:hypothetical protein
MQGRINTWWQSVWRHTRVFVADLDLFLSLQLARLIVYRNTRKYRARNAAAHQPAANDNGHKASVLI